MIRIFAIAALLTLAASPGQAGINRNGVEPNGIRVNGVEPNGINRNGIRQNGFRWNGTEAGEAATTPALRGLILRDGSVILPKLR